MAARSIHQEEQNCEISGVDRHAMMTLWQVYTNTRWQHVTACWGLMYQLVWVCTQNNENRIAESVATSVESDVMFRRVCKQIWPNSNIARVLLSII